MGIVKVDLLGLGMMAVMKECLDLVPRITMNHLIWHNYRKMRKFIKVCERRIR